MANKPNILLILADDHGYGDISAHDGPSIQTPNIDRIADEGVRFTKFYANCSVCSPSRASLMTGRYPDRVGVLESFVHIHRAIGVIFNRMLLHCLQC